MTFIARKIVISSIVLRNKVKSESLVILKSTLAAYMYTYVQTIVSWTPNLQV